MDDGEHAVCCKADEPQLHGGQVVGGVEGGGGAEAESLDSGGEGDTGAEADDDHRRKQKSHAVRDEHGQNGGIGNMMAGECIQQAEGKPGSQRRGDGGGDDDHDDEKASGANGNVDEQAREENEAEDVHKKVEEFACGDGVHGESKDPGDGEEGSAGKRDSGMAGAEETGGRSPEKPGFVVGKVDISGSETWLSMPGQLASDAGSFPSHSTTAGAARKLAAAQSSAAGDSPSSEAGGGQADVRLPSSEAGRGHADVRLPSSEAGGGHADVRLPSSEAGRGQADVRLALKLVRAIGETATAEEHRKASRMLDRLCMQDAVSFSSEGLGSQEVYSGMCGLLGGAKASYRECDLEAAGLLLNNWYASGNDVLQTAVLSLVPHLIASEVAAFAVADGSGAEVCTLLLGIYNSEVRNLSRGSDAAGPSRDARSMSASTMGINNFMTMYSNDFQGGGDVASQLSEHTLKNHSNFLSEGMASPGKMRAGGHALTYTSRNRGAVLSCIIDRYTRELMRIPRWSRLHFSVVMQDIVSMGYSSPTLSRESVKSEVVTRDLSGAAEDDGGHAATSCNGHRGDATTGAAWRLGSIQVIIARMKSKIRMPRTYLGTEVMMSACTTLRCLTARSRLALLPLRHKGSLGAQGNAGARDIEESFHISWDDYPLQLESEVALQLMAARAEEDLDESLALAVRSSIDSVGRAHRVWLSSALMRPAPLDPLSAIFGHV